MTLVAAAALLAWAYIGFIRLRAQAGAPRLEPRAALSPAPPAAAIIPARDEADTIRAAIASHFACDYAGRLDIVLVDDSSTDGTAGIAREAAANATRARGERTLTIVQAPPPPSGWSGKLAALDAGVEAARRVAPHARYYLFADADIVLAPATLGALVAHAEQDALALVSLMARLDSRGAWGRLLVPAFVFFFQKLYPFHRINTGAAAAAGGCMLARRETYERAGGVAAFHGALIDDCAMARAMRAAGGRLRLALAESEARSLRDNRGLPSIWSMVSRTAFTQLNRSYALTAAAFAGMLVLYWSPPAVVVAAALGGNDTAAAIAAAAYALMAFAYLPTARLYRLSIAETFALPVAAFLYALMTVSSAVAHARRRGGLWKGRVYPQTD